MNSIKETFFKTFGIKQRDLYACDWQAICTYPDIKCGGDCPHWVKYSTDYPNITDKHLLIILSLINAYDDRMLFKTNYQDLIEEILQLAIETGTNDGIVNCSEFKRQVRELFEEE